MSKKILGLDIRKTSVAAVLINSGLKTHKIEAHTYIPITGQEDDQESLASTLETLTKEMKLTDVSCIASLPAEQISFRNLQLPFKQQKKIKQILPFELEPIIPVPVEDLIIDFNTIESDNFDTKTDLLTASVNKLSLESYINQLTPYKIDPEVITAGGYPQALCLVSLSDIPENSIFLDIDPSQTTIVLIVGGKIQLVRSIPSGLIDVTTTESLCLNIKYTISAFTESTETDYKPDRIYFSGKGLSENGFEREMSKCLDIPSQNLDLIRESNLEVSKQTNKPWLPDQMNNALALTYCEITGIKGLNFRKGPFTVAKQWAEHKKSIIISGILAGVLLISLLTNSMIDYYGKKAKLGKIQKQTETIFKATFPDIKMNKSNPGSQLKNLVEEAKKASRTISNNQSSIKMIDILNEISTRTPKSVDVELTQMVLGEESILVTGNTDTFNSVDEMKVQLEKAELFKTVTIVSTNKDKSGNRIRFKLKLLL